MSLSPSGLSRHALITADRYLLPTVYDAHYIALAEMLGVDLWTADQRLRRAVGTSTGVAVSVKWIGGYVQP